MAAHNDLGIQGESLAKQHLINSGYSILEENWRFGKEEIDIIAQIGSELVIVEVKTRTSDFFGEPHLFVSKAKQRHLIRAAAAYIDKHNIDLETRFDVVGVILNKAGHTIDHMESAYQPSW